MKFMDKKLLCEIAASLTSKRFFHFWKTLNWKDWIYLGSIGVFLFLPFVLTYYTPAWNAVLKQIPIIKSSSTMVRWYSIYIPVVILLAVLILERTAILLKYRYPLVVISILFVIISNVVTERNYYHQQKYNPNRIEMAYQQTIQGKLIPQINGISSNKDLTQQVSQMPCYEPIFGYRLESFPLKTLHQGSSLAAGKGRLNIKNPACYLYPEENQCAPGDHFTTSQIKDARLFLNYQPFSFEFSLAQKMANFLSLCALIGVVIFLIGGGSFYLLALLKPRILEIFQKP